MTREEALRAVDLARKACCGYIGEKCDCKYGAAGGSEQTGCPELRELGAVLSRVTDAQWLALESAAFDEADPIPAEPPPVDYVTYEVLIEALRESRYDGLANRLEKARRR